MTLRQQFVRVVRDTGRLIRKQPWMLCLPLLVVWLGTHTAEERRRFIYAQLNED